MGLYPRGAGELAYYQRRIDEIAGLGATAIALVTHWEQADIRARAPAPGKLTIRDRVLQQLIAHAHGRKLAVLVFPILHLRTIRLGEWRGTLAPTDIGEWWAGYERFILHYARIAARHRAASLLIGSELGSTERWRARWYHLISKVRRSYRGKLVYSANWDHYPIVSFWRRVDYIGVTGYFELSKRNDASESELTRAWQAARTKLLAFARRHGKPLWITEVGYPSQDGAATQPWNYTRTAKVDVEEQRRCYAAFIAAWSSTRLAGVFFWSWHGSGGPKDTGYTPRGKPAEQLLRRWFR